MNAADTRPLIAHVIHHLVTGGMENGLVNLVNRLPESRYRHAVICMMDYSDFRFRITRQDVAVYAMNKEPGIDWRTQLRLLKLFKELRPAIVHGRSLGALDCLLPAALAGVKIRIFGEHGRDERDPQGLDRKLIWMRRLHMPLVTHYVALSGDLERYLTARVGVAPARVTRIYNGVDVQRFAPRETPDREVLPEGFRDPDCYIVGTVGRLQPVKDQATLARAFVQAVEGSIHARRKMRLVIVGDGPKFQEVASILRNAGVDSLAWLPGDRADVSRILASFDLFVLPSIAEGVSNTILEAMATGLPVLATRVGGNPELVEEGSTGALVPASDSASLSEAMLEYFGNLDRGRQEGRAGRERVERHFSLDQMLENYDSLYAGFLSRYGAPRTDLQSV